MSHLISDGSAKSVSQRAMQATVRAMQVMQAILVRIFFFSWSGVWEVVDHFAPDSTWLSLNFHYKPPPTILKAEMILRTSKNGTTSLLGYSLFPWEINF